MQSDGFSVRRSDDVVLAGERRGRPGAPAVVLLHANVADRRSWHGVLDLLERDDLDLVAYDRRGFGDTPPAGPGASFTHLEDLVAVLDAAGIERALVVGNSYGGALALDVAATRPDRVSAVLHLCGGASGMTDEGEDAPYALDGDTQRLIGALERAQAAQDRDEQVRLLLHLWLDGPTQREGRVGGPARELVADMNRRILEWAAPDDAGDSGLDVWHGLGGIRMPVTVAWGELDVPADLPYYARIAARIPGAVARPIPGTAHLPSVERPETVAALIRERLAP